MVNDKALSKSGHPMFHHSVKIPICQNATDEQKAPVEWSAVRRLLGDGFRDAGGRTGPMVRDARMFEDMIV
jgi:hypothetical protein